MGRAEKRRQDRQKAKDPARMYKASDIQRIKDEATNKAIDTAFILMLGLPVMVLNDKWGWFDGSTEAGKKKLEKFTDQVLDLYDSFNKGYVDFDDIIKTLEEETGIKLELNTGGRK